MSDSVTAAYESDREQRNRAFDLARKAHLGQVDKGGEPYIRHIMRVELYAGMMSGLMAVRIVALLHDVVEDTPITIEDLGFGGYGEEVLEAVDALTRREGESNKDYVLRVAENEIAVIVKRVDYLDNMDPGRLARIEPGEAKRLVSVMADSQKILGKALIDKGAA